MGHMMMVGLRGLGWSQNEEEKEEEEEEMKWQPIQVGGRGAWGEKEIHILLPRKKEERGFFIMSKRDDVGIYPK